MKSSIRLAWIGVGLTGFVLAVGCSPQPTPNFNSLTPYQVREKERKRLAAAEPQPRAESQPAPARPGPHVPNLHAPLPLQRTVPATDLPVLSHPFDGQSLVSQSPVRPYPSQMSPGSRALVQDLLTFDPAELESSWKARCDQDLDRLYYDQHDFAAVDLVAETLRTKRLLDPSGKWMLEQLYSTLTRARLGEDRGDYVRLAQSWLEQNPQSSAARCVLGEQLLNWPLPVPYDVYKQNRDPALRRLSQTHRRQAEQLLEAGDLAHDPLLGGVWLDLLMSSAARPEQLRAGLLRCWAIDAAHVWTPDRAYSFSLLSRPEGPKLGRAFLDELVTRTESEMGQSLYAVVVDYNLNDPEYLRQVRPDWSRVARGFNDLLTRYPHSEDYFRRAIVAAQLHFDSQQLDHLEQEFQLGKICPPFSAQMRQNVLRDLGQHHRFEHLPRRNAGLTPAS